MLRTYIKLNNQAYRNYQFYEGLKAEYEFALSDYKHYADTGAGNNHQSFISSKIYYERVLYDYCKAIELNRRYADVYNNRKNFYDLALADYSEAIKLSDSSEYKKQLCFVASNVAVTAKEYSKAVAYIEQAFEQADSKEQQHEAIYLKSIEYAEELDIKNQELEKKYKQLQLEIQQKEAAQKQVSS